MQRYRQYGPLDDFPEVFGDVQFGLLDMKTDPAVLPAGALQVSENLRFDTNGVTVRGGLSRQFPAGASVGTIRFCGVYKPEGAEDRLVLVTLNKLWLFEPLTQTLTEYGLPSGNLVQEGDDVDLIQAGLDAGGTLPQLFLLHGHDNPVMVFNGGSVTPANAVPPSSMGLYYQNRLAVNSTNQKLSVSDFLDFTTWSTLSQFQIEKGGADYLVGMIAYQKDYVLIGCRKKFFLAYFDPNVSTGGYSGGVTDASFLRLLTAEAGPVGKEAMLESAGLIWFITDNGIYAFQPQLDNSLTVLGRPLSADIQPVFGRLSANYASGASIQRFGYRLYFALPISDVPVAITAVQGTGSVELGADLPVDVPFDLAAGGIATITTATPHNLTPRDTVQIANIAGGGLNGQHTVSAVLDETNFVVAQDVSDVTVGSQATVQKLATRNNVIAVFNLNNRDTDHPLGSWESIDTLPGGLYADWLRVADFGAQRRLWVVDAVNGPALYEEGSQDDVGTVLGGIDLPFDLPVDLTEANFVNTPIRGRLVTRAFRWAGQLGQASGTFTYPRRVRAAETRLTLAAGDEGTVTLRVRTPNRQLLTTTKTFAGDGAQVDVALPLRVGQRGLEAEVELVSTSGRPTVRAVEVQVMKSGQY